jgi:hypothetical protein
VPALIANMFVAATNRTNIHNKTTGIHQPSQKIYSNKTWVLIAVTNKAARPIRQAGKVKQAVNKGGMMGD